MSKRRTGVRRIAYHDEYLTMESEISDLYSTMAIRPIEDLVCDSDDTNLGFHRGSDIVAEAQIDLVRQSVTLSVESFVRGEIRWHCTAVFPHHKLYNQPQLPRGMIAYVTRTIKEMSVF